MKRFVVAGLLLATWLLQAARAQESYLVSKSRWFNQTSAGAPTPDAQPFRFRVFLENYGLAHGIGTVKLPSGQTRATAEAGNDLVFTDSAASAAALSAIYGAGTYTTEVSLFGSTISGSAPLGADSYPNVPQLDLSALQSINVETQENDIEVPVNAFTGAGDEDNINFVIRDQTGSAVLNDSYSPSDTTVLYINPGILTAGQTYTAEVVFMHIAGRDEGNAGISLASAFNSVTTFTITTSGSGPVDTTPPTLVQSFPASGENMTNRLTAVIFQFSEKMDSTRQPVQWSATQNGQPFTLDSTKFFIAWDSEGQILTCLYNLTGGGWPQNVEVTWTLPGGTTGFRDRALNPLVPATGTFHTGQTGGGGSCEGSSPSESAGFGMFKFLNYLQSGAGAPVDDPENGAFFYAFARIPDAPGRAAIEFPADPAPAPHQLKFFGSPGFGIEFLSEQFTNQASLEAAYPPGNYDFQLRNRTNPTVVITHVVMALSASGYPPVPHFSNYAAAQSIPTNTGFNLTWDAYTGVNTNTDSLEIVITNPDGVEVLRLPDTCANKPLPATATSVTIPAGLLSAGVQYTATLNFSRASDINRQMPNTTARGIAGAGRATRMLIRTAGGLPPLGPVRFLSTAFNASGDMVLTVESPIDATLRIRAASNLNGPFNVTLVTTNVTSSPITLVLPRPEPAYGFLRAFADR